jgi:translation initiation factor 2 alpha subunit (eIF-2alpha)
MAFCDSEPGMVFDSMTIDEDVFRELQANITRRLTPQPVKIRADVEVTCFSSEGIDAIKTALLQGEKLETETIPIKVKLVAPPLYVLLTTSTDKQGGIDLLEKALEEIGASIKGAGGDMKIKMKVRMLLTNLVLRLPEYMLTLTLLLSHDPAQDSVRNGRSRAGAAHGASRERKC